MAQEQHDDIVILYRLICPGIAASAGSANWTWRIDGSIIIAFVALRTVLQKRFGQGMRKK
jgi:hypothetical protein